jgi:hypothetical protein
MILSNKVQDCEREFLRSVEERQLTDFVGIEVRISGEHLRVETSDVKALELVIVAWRTWYTAWFRGQANLAQKGRVA